MEGPPGRAALLAFRSAVYWGSWSEPHLLAAERRQVGGGGAAFEIDLEIHRREIGCRASGEEGLLLLGQIGAVLVAGGRRADVDDASIVLAGMPGRDRVTDVGVPPDRIARLHLGDRDHAGHEVAMPF